MRTDEEMIEAYQKPVGYECRYRKVKGGDFDDWLRCSKEFYEKTKNNLVDGGIEWELRAVYTHPLAQLSDKEIYRLICDNGGSMLEFARAIEKAHGIGA